MKYNEFEELSEEEKVAVLYADALYIGKRKVNGRPAILYQLDTFYVEVLYLKYRKYIARFIATDDLTILDPYLEQIKIESFV
ncbi:MAG TPA: hypothetical protein VHK91_10800 [Flavisolibacter sp.]|jgi:hypothetical protein|nr:hypothetical protein [Flavisolibacter sp.]